MDINFKQIILRDNPTILDIGCCNGNHSIMFAEMFPKGKVFSFEADPDIWKIFEDNIKSNGNFTNITLIKKAISNDEGYKSFYRSIDLNSNTTGPSGTFKHPTAHCQIYPHVEFTTIDIECITLDNWFNFQNIDFIDYIWTDVNGAEVALIEGGLNTFNKYTKYLQLECIPYTLWDDQPTKTQLIQMLPEFDLVDSDQTNLLFKNKNL